MKQKIKIQKRLFLFFSAVAVSITSLFAQDVITLKDGKEIMALVYEIGDFDVKYKKFDNPNGPSYVLKKLEILMIKYANGSNDVFADNALPIVVTEPTPITKQSSVQNNKGEVYFNFWGTLKYRSDKKKVKNIEDLLYDIPEALKNYHSAKTWNTVGGAISGGGAGLMGATIGIYLGDDSSDFNVPLFWTGAGMYIVGTIFSSVGSSKIKSAIDLYNASVRRQQASDISLNFGITQSGGIGLTLNF